MKIEIGNIYMYLYPINNCLDSNKIGYMTLKIGYMYLYPINHLLGY